jgi:hypothetical protein
MRKRIISATLAVFASIGFVLAGPVNPAHASGVVVGSTANGHYCHGNNCALGEATVSVSLRFFVSDTGIVEGTEAQCVIHDVRGITRVQVDSCREGVVGGVTLATGGPVNNATDATVVSPNSPQYVATIRFPGDTTGFSVKAVGNFSIRWSDGQLATPGDFSSATNGPFSCSSNGAGGCQYATLFA